MTPSDFKYSLARRKPPDKLVPALVALWWAGKDDWNKAHQIVANGEGADCAWVTLTCTVSRAISTMPVIGIDRQAAHRQPLILLQNGLRSPQRCWTRSTLDRASRGFGVIGYPSACSGGCASTSLTRAKTLLEGSANSSRAATDRNEMPR